MGERKHIQLSGTGPIDEEIVNPESHEILELRLALAAVKNLADLQLVRAAPSGFTKTCNLYSPEVDPTTGTALTDNLAARFVRPISVKAGTPVSVVWPNPNSVAWELEIVIDSM